MKKRTRYFELAQKVEDDAWGVDVPVDQFEVFSTIWEFIEGKRCEYDSPVRVDIEDGREVDFNVTALGIIVLTLKAKDAFEKSCGNEVQFIPAVTESGRVLSILNPLKLIDCIDHERSTIQYHTSRARALRHKLGKPQMITRLVLTQSAIQDWRIFRVQDWQTTVVASEAVCRNLTTSSISGLSCAPVT